MVFVELSGARMVAGKDSGERLWPFPMDPDFDTALKSSVADVLQCTVSRSLLTHTRSLLNCKTLTSCSAPSSARQTTFLQRFS
jgi:hypothetical protein